MAGYHAPIAPSSLALTVACNAWVQMSRDLPPEPDTPESLEGNAADWVAKQYAKGNEVAYGTETPVKGIKVDYDMIHGAKMWARTLRYGHYSGVPVVITRIHPTACWGEPDGASYDGIEQVLHVPDYKYGFDLVEVFENWQVMAYAIGLLDTLGLNDEETTVKMTIVQPRAFHRAGPIREWIVNGADLRAFATIAHNAAMSALRKPGELMWNKSLEAVAGPHCMTHHCPARHVCPTLQLAAGHISEWTRKAESPLELTPEAMGTEWTILRNAFEVLRARKEGLETQIESLLRKGERVPGAKMESGGAPLKWKPGVTIEDVLGLGRMQAPAKDFRAVNTDPNSRKCQVVTPTQAIKAGADESLVKVYAEPTPSAMKLVPDDGTEARKAFGATPG